MPSRRNVLQLVAGSALIAALPRAAFAESPPAPIRFRVLRDGKPIGSHAIVFKRSGRVLRVSTAIDLEVKIAFIPAFRFIHRGEEDWEDQRLVSLRGTTDENGERYEVNGTLANGGLEVTAPSGTTIAPAPAFTTNNLWNPTALQAKNLIDAHHGGLVGLVGRREGEEDIAIGGKLLTATRYHIISPFLAGTLWYDQGNRWRKSVFELKGEQVKYQPI